MVGLGISETSTVCNSEQTSFLTPLELSGSDFILQKKRYDDSSRSDETHPKLSEAKN